MDNLLCVGYLYPMLCIVWDFWKYANSSCEYSTIAKLDFYLSYIL